MPKKCVEMKMKGGMSRKAAVKACYPKAVDKIKKTRKNLKENFSIREEKVFILNDVSCNVQFINVKYIKNSRKPEKRVLI